MASSKASTLPGANLIRYLGVGEEFPGCNNHVAEHGGSGRLSPSTRAGEEQLT